MEGIFESLEIVTDRLIFRKYTLQDFDRVHNYAKNSDVSLYEAWGPNSESDTKCFLQRCIEQYEDKNSRQDFAVVFKKNNEVIGGCSIKPIDVSKCSIGYLVNPAYQKMGVATELAKALVIRLHAHAFNAIVAHTDSRNLASIRVLEKCDFVFVRKMINSRNIRGKFYDTLEYIHYQT